MSSVWINALKIGQIAKGLGVHHTTVSAQRDELKALGQVANLATSKGAEIPHLTTAKGADGKEYPRQEMEGAGQVIKVITSKGAELIEGERSP